MRKPDSFNLESQGVTHGVPLSTQASTCTAMPTVPLNTIAAMHAWANNGYVVMSAKADMKP